MEPTSSHKYIKNTSTSRTIHKEHLLNAGRRPQISERARKPPCSQVGQKKKKREREKGIRMGLCPREGAVMRKYSCTSRVISLDRGGALEPRRRVQPLVCSRQVEGDVHRQSVLPPCTPQPETFIRQCGQQLGAGFRGQTKGKDQGWLCGDSLKRLECCN